MASRARSRRWPIKQEIQMIRLPPGGTAEALGFKCQPFVCVRRKNEPLPRNTICLLLSPGNRAEAGRKKNWIIDPLDVLQNMTLGVRQLRDISGSALRGG